MSTKSKPRRYRNLINHFSNWPQYLWFRTVNLEKSFVFRLKRAFSVEVPRQMLSAFRECFFDQIYLKHLPSNAIAFDAPTIIDIGANVGYFSLFMFYQFPKAKIFSFEPMPFNFKRLKDYQDTYPQFDWSVENKAVSGQSEPIVLHANAIDGYTTMASVFDKPSNSQHIEVSAITLPEVLAKYDIDRIDILKLDCEGSEYSILYSLPGEILEKVRVIIVETHIGSESEETTEALDAYLLQMGFKTYCISEKKSGYIWAWREKK